MGWGRRSPALFRSIVFSTVHDKALRLLEPLTKIFSKSVSHSFWGLYPSHCGLYGSSNLSLNKPQAIAFVTIVLWALFVTSQLSHLNHQSLAFITFCSVLLPCQLLVCLAVSFFWLCLCFSHFWANFKTQFHLAFLPIGRTYRLALNLNTSRRSDRKRYIITLVSRLDPLNRTVFKKVAKSIRCKSLLWLLTRIQFSHLLSKDLPTSFTIPKLDKYWTTTVVSPPKAPD